MGADGGQLRRAGSHRAPLRRALVVDDNVDSAETLAMLLGAHGLEVRTAYDGAAAVAAADEFRPELIFMDIAMPRLDGVYSCERIRRMPWARDVRILALTALDPEDLAEVPGSEGFDSHLTKPLDPRRIPQLL